MVRRIQKKLEEDGAAADPGLEARLLRATGRTCKNLIPHNNIYNFGRMQDVWLDK